MKYLLINVIFFVITVNSDSSKPLFLPQLPLGEYRINVLGILRCQTIQSNDKIKFNYYLSKTSTNTTELKGNATYLVPVDDSLNIEIILAVKDSINGWKDNAHIFKISKACSSVKMYFGDTWSTVMESLGFHNIHICPIPAGFYKVGGFKRYDDLYARLPKQFFYGTYKFRFQFTKNKEVYGCVIGVIEVKRPWEMD